MSYAAPADITKHLGQFSRGFTATSNPTTADAQTFLDDISGEIDAVLNERGIVTPVTLATGAPQSFLDFLKVTNAIGVAAQIVAAIVPQVQGPTSTTYDEKLDAEYEERLGRLRTGMIPDLIVVGAGGALARSYWTTNPFTESGEEHEPAFTREMNW